MNEIKPPKKPLIYYYGIAFVLLILFNSLIMPFAEKHQIEEVSYNTFIQKTEDKDIGSVKIEDNEITFTDKDKSHVYRTGEMNDPDLVKRLAASGADFKNIPARQASPIENFFLNWILPILILWGIGSYVSGKMMNRMGGNAMTFGKANAKVYVKSKDGGITFADVAGEDEAKESLSEIVNYLHDPNKYQEIGASLPKGILLVGPPCTGKSMLEKAVSGE